jgi:tRNA threonylcarbamoyladenosine dehydratase
MSNPSDLRFDGMARLLGSEGFARLSRAHVAVIGTGGVGSWTVEALARSGLGVLTLIDLDEVCVSNINRQLPALQSTVGRAKVEVLAERVADINPACHVRIEVAFLTRATADRLLSPAFDWVVDAIDSIEQKAFLIAECRRRGLKVLTCGGAGGRRDATAVRVADLGVTGGDPLLRQLRKRLRADHGWPSPGRGPAQLLGVPAVYSEEPPVFPWADGVCRTSPEPGSELRMDCASGFGSATFVTGAFGFAAAGEIVRSLAEGR